MVYFAGLTDMLVADRIMHKNAVCINGLFRDGPWQTELLSAVVKTSD